MIYNLSMPSPDGQDRIKSLRHASPPSSFYCLDCPRPRPRNCPRVCKKSMRRKVVRRGREGGGRKEKEEEEEEEKDEERGGGRREEEEERRRRKRRRRESPKHSLAFDQLKIDQTVSPRQQQENKAPPPAPPPTLQPPAAPFPTAPLRQCLSWA